MAIGTKSVTGNSSLRNIEGSLVVSQFMAPSGESYLFSPGMRYLLKASFGGLSGDVLETK